jgi:5-methylcytosine-specific restriction endonuclease McrA
MSSYPEKLSSPSWQKRRLEIFERDGWKCTRHGCGRSDLELHVHHTDYWPGKLPHEYPDEMLQTLCAICHEKENGRDKTEKWLFQTLKNQGFTVFDILALTCKMDTDRQFVKNLLKEIRACN